MSAFPTVILTLIIQRTNVLTNALLPLIIIQTTMSVYSTVLTLTILLILIQDPVYRDARILVLTIVTGIH